MKIPWFVFSLSGGVCEFCTSAQSWALISVYVWRPTHVCMFTCLRPRVWRGGGLKICYIFYYSWLDSQSVMFIITCSTVCNHSSIDTVSVCVMCCRQWTRVRLERLIPQCPAKRTSRPLTSGKNKSWKWRRRKVRALVESDIESFILAATHSVLLFFSSFNSRVFPFSVLVFYFCLSHAISLTLLSPSLNALHVQWSAKRVFMDVA